VTKERPSKELRLYWRRWVPVADTTPSPFERRMARASTLLSAVTDFLMQVAALLRQLVHLAGWIVLLAGCVELLISPHLTTGHLAVPSAGALAVLQSLIKPRRQSPDNPNLPDQPS
jgi:hypothetical protein